MCMKRRTARTAQEEKNCGDADWAPCAAPPPESEEDVRKEAKASRISVHFDQLMTIASIKFFEAPCSSCAMLDIPCLQPDSSR